MPPGTGDVVPFHAECFFMCTVNIKTTQYVISISEYALEEIMSFTVHKLNSVLFWCSNLMIHSDETVGCPGRW